MEYPSLLNFYLDKDWIYKEEDKKVQIIKTVYTENVEIITCELKVTFTVGYCGFNHLGIV